MMRNSGVMVPCEVGHTDEQGEAVLTSGDCFGHALCYHHAYVLLLNINKWEKENPELANPLCLSELIGYGIEQMRQNGV